MRWLRRFFRRKYPVLLGIDSDIDSANALWPQVVEDLKAGKIDSPAVTRFEALTSKITRDTKAFFHRIR